MRVLIADDDAVLRHALTAHLRKWGWEVVVCADGAQAQEMMRAADAPAIVLLDWSMPLVDGLTLCRALRADPRTASTYVVLLSAHDEREDMVAGLECGVDEYLTKPVDWDLLRMRLRVAARLVALQASLSQRIAELQGALDEVKTLTGLLPICSYCKRIRDDGNYWQQLEGYISAHTGAEFSHGVCPECYERAVKEFEKA
jgi:DNA-binding response OmpR family regulator